MLALFCSCETHTFDLSTIGAPVAEQVGIARVAHVDVGLREPAAVVRTHLRVGVPPVLGLAGANAGQLNAVGVGAYRRTRPP